MQRPVTDLEEVHLAVLTGFIWKPDKETFGFIDHWARPLRIGGLLIGDCEDFALECWHRLRFVGWDIKSLRFGLCSVYKKNDHMVLTANYEGHLLVLDNRQREVKRIEELRYDSSWFLSSVPITKDWEFVKIE